MRKKIEQPATTGSSQPEDQSGQPHIELVNPSPQVAIHQPHRSPQEQAAVDAVVPQPARYRVLRGGRVMHRQSLVKLNAGKVISETEYNIPQLQEQGVALEQIPDETPAEEPVTESL